MAKTLLTVTVYKGKNPSEGARVVFGSVSNNEIYTDRNGVANFEYPWDTGAVDIYVNGETAYSDYVSSFPESGLIVRI